MGAHGEQLENAAINAATSRAANGANLGEMLVAGGKTVVYMDDGGRIVTRRPGQGPEEARC